MKACQMCKKELGKGYTGVIPFATTKVQGAIGIWSMQCELHAAKAHREQKRVEVLDNNKIIRHNAMQMGGKPNAVTGYNPSRFRRVIAYIGCLVETYF